MIGTPQVVHHYSVASAPVGFWRHVGIHRYPRRIWDARPVVWNFFRRELLGRFHGSFGGVGWVLVQPIFQFAVYFFVFGILFSPKDLSVEGPDPTFAIYLFAGILLFNAVSEGTSNALRSVTGNSNLVKKVAFPSETLPLTPVAVATTVYAVGSLVMFAIGILCGIAHVGWHLLAWPLLIAITLTFATGLGLLLAAVNVFVRDIQHLYTILTQAWFFLSPVFWRMPLVQDKASELGLPWAMNVFAVNPMFSMLLAQRQVFGIGAHLPPAERAEYFPFSLGENLAIAGSWALVIFVVGHGFFMSRRHKFADVI